MNNNMIKEISRNGVSGYPVLVILPVLLSIAGWFAYKAITAHSNLWLLVVLCGEENAQPVLNTGSLYS